MADKRKLCAEIDRTLKKVTEGLDTFDDFWQKLNQSINANQKEKLEADMKKEIKKLQRLRDQLKLWLVSPDIKDKQVLMEARKNIEIQMEKFKAIERETKTKAYSKEGLVATGKVDPKEKEKEDILNWISNAIANLNQQYEKLESEAEALSGRKKKLDKEDLGRLEMCQTTLEQHKFHVDKLEAILRLVDNSAVQFEQIQSIRENVEYYVENNHEGDFQANEMIYDELDLDDVTSAIKNEVNPASEVDSDTSPVNSLPLPGALLGLTPQHHKVKDDDGKKKQKVADESTTPGGQNKGNVKISQGSNLNFQSGSSSRPIQTPTKLSSVITQVTQSTTHKPTTASSSSGLGYARVAGKLPANSPCKTLSNGLNGLILPSAVNSHQLPSTPQPSAPGTCNASSTPLEATQQTSKTTTPSSVAVSVISSDQCSVSSFPTCTTSQEASSSSFVNGSRTNFSATESIIQAKWPLIGEKKTDNLLNGTSMANGFVDLALQGNVKGNQDLFLKAFSSEAVSSCIPNNLDSKTMNGNIDETMLGAGRMSEIYEKMVLRPADDFVHSPIERRPDGKSQSPHSFGKTSSSSGSPTQTVHLEPIYSVSPLGYAPFTESQMHDKKALDAASKCLPLPCDSEKVRVYLPNNPCSTPLYYPVALPAVMQLPEFFNKLEPDTLFFVFYYMEGTKAQYQAAKALKLKSWRFHTKYMMWFQRHEEPKTITDDYEQGTYIFFDFERWIQRKKEGFKFEYRYLEDHELA